MASSVNNLTLVVNRQDSNGVNVENRTIGSVTFNGVCGEYDIRQAPDTSSHSLDLPTTEVNNFIFLNTHASATITLTGTINGGSSQTIAKVGPGGVCVPVWATAAGKGFTALSYQSDTIGATFEMFLGG